MIKAFGYGKTLEPFDCFDDFIESLTPIQLPTDEEIKMIIKHYHNSLFYLELSERELENITKIIYKELFGGQDNE